MKGGPELKRYLDKRLIIKLNGNRKISGVLRGFDQFMNLVIDETTDEAPLPVGASGVAPKIDLGMVVIRGNSVVQFESAERVA
jgi:small nuclear ribonucleoprotein G